MKRENLTWAELWPLLGDGQCFDYQESYGSRPFRYIQGALHAWDLDLLEWERIMHGISTEKELFKLVDHPSKPKPQDSTKLDSELEAHAKQIFEILESWHHTNDPSQWERNMQMHVLTKGLVEMLCLVHADTMREIDERGKK
jgi:hypothetical protein